MHFMNNAANRRIIASMGPTLGFRDQEITENLNTGNRFHLLGIGEIAVERGHFHIGENLNEAGFRLDRMEVVFLDSPELAQQARDYYGLGTDPDVMAWELFVEATAV